MRRPLLLPRWQCLGFRGSMTDSPVPDRQPEAGFAASARGTKMQRPREKWVVVVRQLMTSPKMLADKGFCGSISRSTATTEK